MQQWLLLGSLTLIWGTSYILMKKALVVYGPLQLAALRMVFSLLCCLPFLPKAFRHISKNDYGKVAIAGLLGSGIPAFLFALAMTRTNSSVNGIINSLSPLFTVISGALFWQISVSGRKLAGVLIGLLGAVVLVMGKSGFHFSVESGFAIFPVIATFCYGLNSNYIKQKLAYAPALEITAMAMLFLGIPSLIILSFTGMDQVMSHPFFYRSTACLFCLALFGTVVGWILYYRLVQRTDALFAASVTYLIPIVAIAWGLLDGERLMPVQLGGMLLILTGVYFVTR